MARTSIIDTDEVVRISRNHDATFVAIFGSAARGDATDQSDLDLLVAFNSPKSLLDIVQMERELSESIGHKVDLLTEGSISPHIRDRVHSEMQVLYDRRS